MKTPDIPPDEDARLAELRSLNVLDTIAEERFDRLTRMARRLFGVDVALVSLVDESRQWFKSCAGMELSETPRDISFCGHAILGDGAFVIPDALQDERFCDNPMVAGPPHVRFYAGCPLRGPGGRITISLGAALLREQEKTWHDWFSRADAALYRAKMAGRDSYVIADDLF